MNDSFSTDLRIAIADRWYYRGVTSW